MPALNFKPQFIEKIRSGEKRQTIRQHWKRPIKPGDTLYLYTGLRTKAAECFGTKYCSKIEPITIDTYRQICSGRICGITLFLNQTEAQELAADDGFSSVDEFIDFFKKQYGLPFYGVIIHWEAKPPTKREPQPA